MLRFLTRLVFYGTLILVLVLIGLRFAAYARESAAPGMLAPKAGSFVDTQTGRIFVQAAGPEDALPVLLAHGTAAWSGFWQKEVTQLGALGPYRAIAFDMPPFGLSDRAPDGDYSRQKQATRILALVATLQRKPIMVAHSFGAAAATEAVLRQPDAFAGLIIVDGALGMETAPQPKAMPLPLRPRIAREAALAATATNPLATRFLLRGLLYNKAAATDDYIEVLQHPQRRAGTTDAYADWVPSLLAPAADSLSRTPASYASLPIPVRIIWGDRDTVTPPDQAEALAAAIDQGAVVYLKDVGHIPHIEAPDAFMDALKGLLAEMTNQ